MGDIDMIILAVYQEGNFSFKRLGFHRLNLIAKSQFLDRHLDSISNLETILSEMWSLYERKINSLKIKHSELKK